MALAAVSAQVYRLLAELSTKVLDGEVLDKDSKEILSEIQHQFGDGSGANIEDYLSDLIDLFTIGERRMVRGNVDSTIMVGTRQHTSSNLKKAIDQIKQAVAREIDVKVDIQKLQTHRDFVNAVHQPVRVGREPSLRYALYVVLNYDTMIEDALALEKIPYSDGIDGGVTGWWNVNSLDRSGLAARVLKLHGSVNWYEFPDDPLPRRIGPSVQLQFESDRRILIWPASTKYREAQVDPFAQLMERARGAMKARAGQSKVAHYLRILI